MLVAPVTQAAKKDGFARVKAWLPEGRWTDIFTGGTYIAPKGGKRVTLLREMESIPVFIKSGGVLPLSADKGNSVDNPTAMEINVYTGNGKYELYEDGATKNTAGELITRFVNSGSAEGENGKQTLTISTEGDGSVVPQTRLFKIRFKDVAYGEIAVYEDGKKLDGVCGGFAEYLNIDPTIIRLIWAILILAVGTGVLAYIVAAIVMPEGPT